ncbi:helix-turn-helix domain-containing protein [Pseudonocardia sp. SID8383]|uniref:helix-turn-helix domain-containing protein n=1 Tax=Pseudonocardia sp. SID8383 TaxID=2690363 RepID=UPI00136975CB|nr:XRE family transcriptional regulator [Pseudonocardia sp. SID8383]MYW71919.1 ImmA/IrrE family metallo-endopeptidase [Pseudonocardia sp. SID8383]
MSDDSQRSLFAASSDRRRRQRGAGGQLSPLEVHEAFDPVRLAQARNLAGLTKRRLADELGVSPAAVSQYEMGTNRPRADLLPALAEILDVPLAFFLSGRPHARLDSSAAHFRSLRSTRAYQRAKAIALTEMVWELAYALEKRVQLPPVDLPGFTGGEVHPGLELPAEPVAAARALRSSWGLGKGPITHLIRRLEAQGIVVQTPHRDEDMWAVDAFSTSRLPRPVIVLTPNRTNDIYRHRFSAAHELGHLLLHGEAAAGDINQEREADTFAAEFLTPRDAIIAELPERVDFHRLAEVRSTWGVSIHSLLYRSRELGLLSDSSASRAYQRLHSLKGQPGFAPESPAGYLGELPALLSKAFSLACENGMTIGGLARELAWTVPQLRQMLGVDESRPTLELLAN